jgi:prevent-host-death family protein
MYTHCYILEVAVGITTVTSRDFNQDTGRAKKAAEHGPVFITDRGKPAHVLLSIAAFERLSGTDSNLLELIGNSAAADIAFDPPRMADRSFEPASFE